MKVKKTALLATVTLLAAFGVFVFEYKKQVDDVIKNDLEARIVVFQKDQINFIEIQKNPANNQTKYVMQKGPDGWSILEPVQDSADNDQIESLLDILTTEKSMTVAKESADPTQLKLAEFGLESPYTVFNFKNNLGHSQKIYLGSQKNFEGNSFIRVDSQNKVLVASPVWHTKAEQNLMTYREKRLYRESLSKVKVVEVTSLTDKFTLNRGDSVWTSQRHPQFVLDQNKVRTMLKQIAESSVQDYVFDGEPSNSLVQEKRLVKAPVAVTFHTAQSNWSVVVNQHEKDNAVYAMTDRPTNLVKIDPTRWELFGNLSLDSLRDRSSQFKFALNEVSKVYFKNELVELSFAKDKDEWKSTQPVPPETDFSPVELVKLIGKIHDLEVSEFLDAEFKQKAPLALSAKNMLILKSATDNLIMQFNWGPEVKLIKNGQPKDYFYARTSLGDSVFALEKNFVERIDLQQAFKKKDQP